MSSLFMLRRTFSKGRFLMKPNKIIMAVCLSFVSYKIVAGEPIEPAMVTIPAGSFEMGSLHQQSAQPIHTVTLPEFSLGKYEVTMKEFSRFIAATNYPVPQECRHELNAWFRPASKGNWQTNALNTNEFQPVICINWHVANAYTQWLAKETGKPYRLPTEAEWEYAARAGTKTDYFFGDDKAATKVCKYANTADLTGENILQRDSNTSYVNWSTGINHCVDGSGYASIVGMYQPNPHGLYDIISNVLELLADCYTPSYQHTPRDGSAFIEPNCKNRSTRGGSWHWNNWPHAERGSIPEDFAGGVDGFRIALDGVAPSLNQQTKVFLAQLKYEQQQEQARRDLLNIYPEPITDLAIEQSNKLVTLSWSHPNPETVESYRVYRNELRGKMFKLLASNLTNTQFIDGMVDGHKYEYRVVAVSKHQQSHYSKAVITQAGWIAVPGRIEAEMAAEIKGADVSMWTADESGKYTLTGDGGISKEGRFTYQLDVAKAGSYRLHYRVASPRDTKGVAVIVNDIPVATDTFSQTGGYRIWQTQLGSQVHLKQGKNTLILKSLDNNWKLNWLAVLQ